jgi:hypothetical protein
MKKCMTVLLVIATTAILMGNAGAVIGKTCRVLFVPTKYPTIQGAIDAACDGDTVVVAPGRYLETIDFQGKAIVVKSSLGPERTIIDGGQNGSVAYFHSGESDKSVLSGFTITNGSGNFLPAALYGGGVLCLFDSNPTICHNRISGNSAHLGGGVCTYYASPVIECNIVELNETTLFSGGGIIAVGRNAKIVGNVVRNNYAFEHGGGIAVFDARPLCLNNTVTANLAVGAGNGMYCSFFSAVTVTNGIFWDNHADKGFEVHIDHSSSLRIDHTVVNRVRMEYGARVYWGRGISFIDPGIRDGNPKIPEWSPCRDAGAPWPDMLEISPKDFEGDPREVGMAIDVGADEYFPVFDAP